MFNFIKFKNKEKKFFYIDLWFMFLLWLILSIFLYYDRDVLLSDFWAILFWWFIWYLIFFINNINEYRIWKKHIISYPISYFIWSYIWYWLSKDPTYFFCYKWCFKPEDIILSNYIFVTNLIVFGLTILLFFALLLVKSKQK